MVNTNAMNVELHLKILLIIGFAILAGEKRNINWR